MNRSFVFAGAMVGLGIAGAVELALYSPPPLREGIGPISTTEERSYSNDWWTGRVTETLTVRDRFTGTVLGTSQAVVQEGPPLVLLPAAAAAGALMAAAAYSVRRRSLTGDMAS